MEENTRLALLEKRVDALESEQNREENFRKAYYDEREDRKVRDAQLDAKINSICDKLDDVKTWVDEQRNKPAKRWEAVVEKILCVVIGAVVAYALAKFGLG